MKQIIPIALAVAFLTGSHQIFAQSANLEFVENKGQWDKDIRFKGELNNGAFFLNDKGFTVVRNNADDINELSAYYHGASHSQAKAARAVVPVKGDNKIVVHSHAYSVQFVNAGTPNVIPDKPLNSYNNYFIGNDSSKWKGNCRIFQAVAYENLYQGIDARYYTSEEKLKYDLIIHPSADVSQVAMKYTGVDGLEIKNGDLIIKTSVGDIRELSPYAYQVVNGVKKEVNCKFLVAGNVVKFAVENYSKAAELVIDPTLIFATFSGSTADNWGYTATYGADGTFYAGGIVFASGFRTSPGAFQTTYQGGLDGEERIGGYDIGIIKFNANGSDRVYATYIGGSGNEQPHSLVVSPQGELVVAGRTTSSNYPLKGGGLIGSGGNYDIVLTKLNAAGSALVGSMKIGGALADGVNIRPKYPIGGGTGGLSIRRNYGDDARSEVILDAAGDIILASNTQSKDFPAKNGFQMSMDPGLKNAQDAVLIKVTPDLSTILFSTFLGGDGNDAAFVLAINPANNNIYVGGNTESGNLPGDKAGTVYTGFQGGETDGFVSIVSPDGRTLLKTTYIGTDGSDMLYGIQFDKFGFPYVMGTTTGSFPIKNAAFSQPGGKQFIAKLTGDLSAFEYSTVFGTPGKAPNISPIAFLVDRCENVYVSGWGGEVDTRGGYPTSGTSGLTTTPDAIQSSTDNSDFYFFVLERNAGRQLYGSFFGQSGGFGEHVDGGTSRFDRNGVIYQAICANCGRDVPFPTTPGVWAPRNGTSQQCNLAAVKIAFNLAGVAGSVKSSIVGSTQDTTGCVPLSVNFADTIADGRRYIWNFGDGSGDIVTIDPKLSHTFDKIGNYRVRLTSIDSGKCNVADTAYVTIKVRTFKGVLDFAPKKLEPCTAFDYRFGNKSYVLPAAKSYSNTSFRWTFGDNTAPVLAGLDSIQHSFPGPGVYNVRLELLDTAFCNAPTYIEKALRIAINVKADFETPARGCAPYTPFIDNTSAGGQQFYWSFGDNTFSNEVTPVHTYAVPGNYTIKLTAVDSATCNVIDSTAFEIFVSGKPTASFTYTPNPPQENTPVDFFNSSIAATAYLWKFGDEDSLATRSRDKVTHIYNATRIFNACLVAVNNTGCHDTLCANIDAKVLPLLDVPNAFTPNGDNINDKLFVRGFGITKMRWRIFNRWGIIVFETADRTQGWDGTYKGGRQPAEVYHYVLDVEYSDKSAYQKRGDITLLQ